MADELAGALRARYDQIAAALDAAKSQAELDATKKQIIAFFKNVDAVLEVLRISSEAVTMPPAVVRGLAAEYIQGIISVGARMVVLLQTARLLTSTERIALEAVHAEPVHG